MTNDCYPGVATFNLAFRLASRDATSRVSTLLDIRRTNMKGWLQPGLMMGLLPSIFQSFIGIDPITNLPTYVSYHTHRNLWQSDRKWVLAQSEPNVQSLPDGDYFYGDAPTPNEPGAGYLVFRKAGSSIKGLFYQQGENLQFCFTGTDKLSTTKGVSEGKPVPSSRGGEFSPSQSLGLAGLFKLRFDQLPDAAARNYQQCVNGSRPGFPLSLRSREGFP